MIEKLISYIESFDMNYLITLSISIAIVIIFFIFKKQMAKGLLNLLGKMIFRKNDNQRMTFKASLIKPMSWSLAFFGLYVSLRLALGKVLFAGNIVTIFRIGVIVLITWMLVSYISIGLPLFFRFGKDSDESLNSTAIKFVTNILKLLVIVFSVVIIISELGYNISGLITGVGLGGLTIALAAQDSASNLFGGFVIIFDKPFHVGDWITTPSVNGIVEDITVRSTRVRTFADSVITIPNATLANQAITNWSRMNKREVNFTVGLKYDTTNETLVKCKNEIEKYLYDDTDVDNETIRVFFEEFDASSINISIYYFTKAIDRDEYLRVREKVNLKVKEIVENLGAEFAFPSSSIYIEGSNK